MKNQNQIRFHGIGTASALALTLSVAWTGPAEAAWLSGAVDTARSKTTAVTKRVTEAPKQVVSRTQGTIDDVWKQLADMSQKLEMIYAEAWAHQPMMDRLRSGPLMQGVDAAIEFLDQRQDEFQQFENQGAEIFRQDLVALFSDLQGIMQAFPAISSDNAAQRLNKVSELIQHMPVLFLFAMNQAVGPQLPILKETVADIGLKLAEMPKLPRQRDLLADPLAYEPQLCDLVTNKRLATHIATVQARLKLASWMLKSIKDLTPSDLTLSGTVVAGGGVTVSKHPARIPFEVVGGVVVDGVSLRIDTIMTMAKTVCQVTGKYDPNN